MKDWVNEIENKELLHYKGMNLNIRCTKITEFTTHLAENVKHITDAERTSWNGKAPANHNHTIGQVTGLETALNSKVDESTRNQPNGFAGLDGSGKLFESFFPSTSSKSARGTDTSDGTDGRIISLGFNPAVFFVNRVFGPSYTSTKNRMLRLTTNSTSLFNASLHGTTDDGYLERHRITQDQ